MAWFGLTTSPLYSANATGLMTPKLMEILRSVQVLQVTDPAIIAEALRSKELDKKTVLDALNYFAGPHGLPTLLTAESTERWKVVRYLLPPRPLPVKR